MYYEKKTKSFIDKSKKINGEKYDYSLVNYINNKTKVKLICHSHGIFEQRPDNHLTQKQGCPKCNNYLSNFINKSNKVHKNYYNYDRVIYKNNRTKVTITCPVHGDFEQTPELHKNGYGCKKCKRSFLKEKVNTTYIKKSTNQCIKDFIKIHGNKYDYSKVEYTNNRNKVDIICPIHGNFKQSPSKHLRGQNCPKCSKKSSAKKKKLSLQSFIKKAKKIHGNKYDYSKVEYINNMTKIDIMCPIHGNFKQSPSKHLRGQNCPKCSFMSKGEEKISKFLEKNNIKYIKEKTFNGCIFKNKLRFDFYIPENNMCIEFDGHQHFKNVPFFGNSYLLNKKKDLIKNKFCRENGIELIRIPYYEFDTISKYLKNILN